MTKRISRESCRVLVLNAGSTSFKWALLAQDAAVVESGDAPWAGESQRDRVGQVQEVLRRLPHFDAVGHRVVHGGPAFRDPVLITTQVRAALGELVALAPDHMPAALWAMDAAAASYPKALQVAAFDTAFHATMPEACSHYALPAAWSARWDLRRYGFHGLSVAYAVDRVSALLGEMPSRLVVCHLGGGCSVTAVAAGRSIDTSMGFSPLEGLVMSTRAGSLDPGLIMHLQRECGVGLSELQDMLSHGGGLLGVSGVSGSLTEVLQAADAGHERARLAYDLLVTSVRRAVGSAICMLGGLDALIFTGGMGENSPRLRTDATRTLAFAGVHLDPQANAGNADRDIASARSQVRCFVLHAREDLAVRQAVLSLV